MTSAIDVTVPAFGNPTTASERANWTTASSEIGDLQSAVATLNTAWASGPFLKLAGGVLKGPLELVGDPLSPLAAATRQYVDNNSGSGAASSTLPLMSGTAAVGTGTTWARADHVHPSDTSRATVASLSNYFLLAGPATVTGGATFNVGAAFGTSTTSQAAHITINGAANSSRGLAWNTANSNRWRWGINAIAEVGDGSNVGGDLFLNRFNDSGGSLGALLTFTRSTGISAFSSGINLTGGSASAVNDFSKQLQLSANFGLTVTTNRLNYVSAAVAAHYFVFGAADVAKIEFPAGLTMLSGAVTLLADPSSNLQASTKQYVDNLILQSGSSGATAPTTTQIPAGKYAVWKNTTDASVKVYYNDAGTMRSVTLA